MKNLLIRIFLSTTKPLSILKYIFLMPMVLQGQPEEGHCTKDEYYSFWDKKTGPVINGKKAVYHFYEVPFYKISHKKGSYVYEIKHPGLADECKEEVLIFKDEKKIIEGAEDGDKYMIVVAMMYLDDKPTNRWFVCPAHVR